MLRSYNSLSSSEGNVPSVLPSRMRRESTTTIPIGDSTRIMMETQQQQQQQQQQHDEEEVMMVVEDNARSKSRHQRRSIRDIEHEWNHQRPPQQQNRQRTTVGRVQQEVLITPDAELHRIQTKARQLRSGRHRATSATTTTTTTTGSVLRIENQNDDDHITTCIQNDEEEEDVELIHTTIPSYFSPSSLRSLGGGSSATTSSRKSFFYTPHDTTPQRSYRADQAERHLLQGFHVSRPRREDRTNDINNNNNVNSTTKKRTNIQQSVVSPSPIVVQQHRDDDDSKNNNSGNGTGSSGGATTTTSRHHLALHDLCGEAVSVEDIAWRNAVHLLAQSPTLATTLDRPQQSWTPLHICCLSDAPEYMIRALLHVYPEATTLVDDGGRLPLHLLAATTANIALMELIVQANPAAICAVDHHGCTPLQLLLRNRAIQVTFRHVQVLLGMTTSSSTTTTSNIKDDTKSRKNPSIRRGEHLTLNLDQLDQWRRRPAVVTNFLHHNDIDTAKYSHNDVRIALRSIATWKAAQGDVEVAWNGTAHPRMMRRETSNNNDASVFLRPAEIPNDDNEYPIHLVIQRAFVDQTPLEMSRTPRDNHHEDDDDDIEEQKNPADNITIPSIVQATSIVRLLAAECPEALTIRDSFGLTPLLHILLQPEVPDTELIETLLGKRHCHNNSCDDRINAAMIAFPETQQLPLHIVAEEYAGHFPMIRAVVEAYPFAKGVQDARGRTPLHLALHSYRRIPADPRVLDLLYKESIAKVVDDYGNTPALLLLQGRRSLPQTESDIYQRIFAASTESFELSELRTLPPWLRAEACATKEIQNLIVQDLAQPWKTALILLDGILLVLLLTVFRIQMKQYVDYLKLAEPIQSWYTFVVYAAAMLRFFGQILLGIVAASIGEFQHLFATNIWYWIGLVATMFCMVTSAQLYGSGDNPERLLALGTTATCLLWISLVGYMTTWFHGMAVFAGAFVKCFYTLLQLNCSEALGGPPVCTERDAYRVVYYLIRGIPIAAPAESVQLSNDAVLLVAMLMAILLTFCIAMVVTVLVAAGTVNFDDIALHYYWEHKLALVVAPEDFHLERNVLKTKRNAWSTKLGEMWDAANTKNDDPSNTHWYALPHRSSLGVLYIFLVVPLWFMVGFLSLGLLWPYQVREWLYRPNRTMMSNSGRSNTQHTTSQSNADAFSLREEMADLKHVSSEKSSEIKREIRQLKDLLLMMIDDDEE